MSAAAETPLVPTVPTSQPGGVTPGIPKARGHDHPSLRRKAADQQSAAPAAPAAPQQPAAPVPPQAPAAPQQPAAPAAPAAPAPAAPAAPVPPQAPAAPVPPQAPAAPVPPQAPAAPQQPAVPAVTPDQIVWEPIAAPNVPQPAAPFQQPAPAAPTQPTQSPEYIALQEQLAAANNQLLTMQQANREAAYQPDFSTIEHVDAPVAEEIYKKMILPVIDKLASENQALKTDYEARISQINSEFQNRDTLAEEATTAQKNQRILDVHPRASEMLSSQQWRDYSASVPDGSFYTISEMVQSAYEQGNMDYVNSQITNMVNTLTSAQVPATPGLGATPPVANAAPGAQETFQRSAMANALKEFRAKRMSLPEYQAYRERFEAADALGYVVD